MENRVKFKVGEIEFEAEGSAEVVERERSIFFNALLPAAVDAIVRTRGAEKTVQYINTTKQSELLAESAANTNVILEPTHSFKENDYSRMDLAAYVKNFGTLSEQDFALFSAYFDEIKNGTKYFTKEDLERYYTEARRTMPTNVSMSLNRLAEKGFIMDAVDVEQKIPKPYIVSSEGIGYIQSYKPKEEADKKTAKPRKTHVKVKSSYSQINGDNLNLDKYPEVKTLKDFKEKMMMVLYILTQEKKGEWFTTADVLCLMTDIFGEHANENQVNGVFKREKLWFKAESMEGNKKEVRRKLLNKGMEYAKALITTA